MYLPREKALPYNNTDQAVGRGYAGRATTVSGDWMMVYMQTMQGGACLVLGGFLCVKSVWGVVLLFYICFCKKRRE